MTFIIGCVIFAALLLPLSKVPLGIIQTRQPGGYDNRIPRSQQAALPPIGQRALGAHQNAFEAFPPFATGVLLALWSNAPIRTVQTLCAVFIIARLLHIVFYLADLDRLRSAVWMVGMGCSIWLMCLALPG